MQRELIIKEQLTSVLKDTLQGANEAYEELGEIVVLGFLSKHWHISPFRGDDVV